MNPDIIQRPSEAHDPAFLAPILRDIDKLEISCVSSMAPIDCLTSAYDYCEVCDTAVYKGRPIAMFGITATDWGGVPWLLGTDALSDVKLTYTKIARGWVSRMVEDYRVLRNFVHEDNSSSVRWLRDCLGFQVGRERILMKDNPFLSFERSM